MRDDALSSRHIFIFLIIAFLLAVTIAAATLTNVWALLLTPTDTTTTSSPSGLEVVTSNGLDELTMIRGCTETQLLKMSAANLWACADDITTSVTGAGTVRLDLADDGADESAALGEIAITGDTNSIFTEPSPDKLLINVGLDWPKADAADALTANPTDCAANQFANAIVASGNLTCAQVNFTDLAGAATDAQVPNTITVDLAATATVLAANPADCAANQFAQAIAASGALTCAAVVTGDITNGTILPIDLDDGADVQADEECLTFEGTGSIFEWQTCGGAGANSFETMDASSGTDPVADGASDTLIMTGTSPITVTGDSAADSLTFACATCVTAVTGGAGITSSGGTTPAISTNSIETDFLSSSNLTCGAGTAGRITVSATGNEPLQYCDGSATPILRYAAYGNVAGVATSATALAANGANCSAGNYPLGVDASGAVESCTLDDDIPDAADYSNLTGGAGIVNSPTGTIATASGETDFLASGALTCGAGTQGRMQVHTTPLQYCDNDGGDTLRYAAYGSSTGVATSATALAANGANCSAGSAPLGVDASGAAESCFDVEEEANIGTTVITGNAADDQVLIGSAASAATWSAVPDCNTNNRDRVQYDTGTNAFSCDSDVFGPTDIDQTANYVWTGTHDFGGAPSVEVPNAAAPTVDADGEIAVDVTDDQFVYQGDTTSRVLSHKKTISFILESPADVDNFLIKKFSDAVTLLTIDCIIDPADAAESVAVTVQETNSTGDAPGTMDAITCDNDGAVETTFTDGAMAAAGWMAIDIGTVTGTVTQVVITVEYTLVRE